MKAVTKVARFRFGKQLKAFTRLPDMHWAVREHATKYRFTKGDVWSFWLEDDPRFEDGINIVSRWKCTLSGDDDSEWIEILG